MHSKRDRARDRGKAMATAAALIATLAATTGAPAREQGASHDMDRVRPLIEAVLYDPVVEQRIRAWGLSVADVWHDVDAMSAEERARLAYVLTRRWYGNDTHGREDQQAQFLVTMSLMRESKLFASVVSTGSFRLR